MSALFSPLALRGVTLPNRIMVSPMCQYSAENGAATDWHMMHLGAMALSGAGLLCIEATAVEQQGRITPGCLGLWDDVTEAALAKVITGIRRYSKVPIVIQLAHAGRKASSRRPWEGGAQIALADGGWIASSASAAAYKDGESAPVALDRDGLARVRRAFVASARRAIRLGLDGIELHAAHGYLLHQFLSPLSNHRNDEYGGSIENRLRLPLEIFDEIRAILPADKPLGVRISATDWVDGGWTLDDSIVFAAALKTRGVDWIDASSGGASPRQKIAIGPGYQVPFAQAIRAKTDVNTIAVGLITDPQQAEQIVAAGQADIVALARALLYDPRWPWHAAAVLGGKIDAPPPYWRAAPQEHQHIYREYAFGTR